VYPKQTWYNKLAHSTKGDKPNMKHQSYPGHPYRLPYDRGKLYGDFWPLRKAAREWGVSFGDALRYMLAHPEWCAWVRVIRADGRLEWIYCVALELYQWAEV